MRTPSPTTLRIERAAAVPLWYAFTIVAVLIDVWLLGLLAWTLRGIWGRL